MFLNKIYDLFIIEEFMKKYLLNQSPFYKLSNKKKLAKILFISLFDLKNIQNCRDDIIDKKLSNDKNFKIKIKKDKKGKDRQMEIPNNFLKKIHERIANLLSNIETPLYLHSAIKNHSYKTNAKVHIGEHSLIKTDISNFYPSTTFNKIFLFFYKTMLCEYDIATILAKICTYNKHLPTGSPLSPILSFFANKNMFDEINDLCLRNNLNFTVYIDDLTISGNGCFKIFGEVLKIIYKNGYKTKSKKNIKYLSGYTKEVTGVIIKNNELRLPNIRYKKIRKLEEEIKDVQDKYILKKKYNELVGRLREGSQFDEKLKEKLKHYKNLNI